MGGLNPNEEITFSAIVRGVVLADGTKLDRRDIQRNNKRSRKLGAQTIAVTSLNEQLEKLQAALSQAIADQGAPQK